MNIKSTEKNQTEFNPFDLLTFEERTEKGWLLPYLIQIDVMFSKRWLYWGETLLGNKILDCQIPQIQFSSPDKKGFDNLRDCLNKYSHTGVYFSDFRDWLLWGFGEGEERANINSDVNEYWYRTFNLGLLLQTPWDYLGEIMAENKQGYWNNPNAFFPTPHHVCEMMFQMSMTDLKKTGEDEKCKTVNDPCVGTGRMLLHASNYSLCLSGNDIDINCVKSCKINGFLYVPWLVKPAAWMVKSKQVESKKINIEKSDFKKFDVQKKPMEQLEWC